MTTPVPPVDTGFDAIVAQLLAADPDVLYRRADAVDAVVSERGRLDIVVNNAGYGTMDPAMKADLSEWQKMVDVNLHGVLATTHAAVAHLTEAGQPKLTPFVNDTSAVPAGQARVTVRHTAAAPAGMRLHLLDRESALAKTAREAPVRRRRPHRKHPARPQRRARGGRSDGLRARRAGGRDRGVPHPR